MSDPRAREEVRAALRAVNRTRPRCMSETLDRLAEALELLPDQEAQTPGAEPREGGETP